MPTASAASWIRLWIWKRCGCALPTPIQMIFGGPFDGNVPMPVMGRKNAPNSIARSFSRSARSTSSKTSPKKPSVRCICAAAIQRTPRTFGSRSAMSWRVDSGKSIATKRRLGIRKQTSNSDTSRASTLNPPSQTTARRRRTSNAQLDPAVISDRSYDVLLSLLRAVALSARRVSQSGIKRRTS